MIRPTTTLPSRSIFPDSCKLWRGRACLPLAQRGRDLILYAVRTRLTPRKDTMSEPAEQETIFNHPTTITQSGCSCKKILSKDGLSGETFEDGAQGLERCQARRVCPSWISRCLDQRHGRRRPGHEIDPGNRRRGHHRIRDHRYRRDGDEMRRLRFPAQAVFSG